MVVRLQRYNQDLIDEFRKTFFDKYPTGHEDFDPRDIQRVKKYDKYLYNVLIISKSNVDVAVEKLEKILKWRKEFEINDLTWDSFNDEFKTVGPLYCRGRDKQNCRILWFRVKHSKKGDPELTRQAKKFIAFWLEKLQWEDFDNPVVIVQDMTGAGVSNMDLDVIRFLIGALELYFPALCEMLYIYEMPWILNAIWKIIEKLLSEESKAHLKFLKAKDVMSCFEADQLPPHMGGTDTYEWSYPPPEQFRDLEDDPEEEEEEEEDEDESEDTKMHSILEADRSADEISPDARNRPGTSGKSMPPMPSKEGGDTLKSTENIPLNEDPDVAVKKVHFADDSERNKEEVGESQRSKEKANESLENKENAAPSQSSVKAKSKKKATIAKKKKMKEVHVGPLISTRPGESLIFKPTGNKNNPKELKSTFTVSNMTDSKVAYKVKTTSPDKYRVRPSSGHINQEASVVIEIIYLGGESEQVVRDKFLVLSTELGDEIVRSTAQLMEFWRTVSKSTVVEHRLKCMCETPPEALVTNHDILKELHILTKKVSKFEEDRQRSTSKTGTSLQLIVVLQFILICIMLYAMFTSQPSEILQDSCYKAGSQLPKLTL
ncbi:putative motile sperm domain-containing protein 2 [Apostichopus japonicus]|uniref:Putative motile sperm domain-containing protein 2 n=1 Tax=Stichopus japonicus TaxID=307972 RepID=A0A2G8KQZ7_STIJA|nr:putative motile sperm domain-containing protein 2 [Apostichopus japonicus]